MLITVKASPAISQKYGEVVCVAGIDIDNSRWIRFWPIHFRDLPMVHRFKKYSIIELRAKRASDPRPESYTPDNASIRILGRPLPAGKSKRRRALIEPLEQMSMCRIIALQQSNKTSLGVFRPSELIDFRVEADAEDWDPTKQAVIDQPSLLAPTKSKLEKVPFKFKYVYRCNDSGCNTHTQSIVDWEISEAYRKWRQQYGEDEALDRIREKWTFQLWGEGRDTFLYAGNQYAAPRGFLVLGVFWPQKLD